MRFPTLIPPLFLVVCGLASAQSAHFEVSSIKPSDPNAKGSSIWSDHGALNATNQTVRNLITIAYGIRDFQLAGGPGWISSDRYDILAKPEQVDSITPPPDAKTRDQLWKERVRSLLSERFRLMIHKETKEGEIYLLGLAKGGPKVKEFTKLGDRQGITSNRGRLQGFAAPMSALANNLSEAVGRPVIDKTGLTAKYDWVLNYDPDTSGAPGQDNASADQRPTIFTAVQEQLGLKLETSKGPIDMWVIDTINRPSQN